MESGKNGSSLSSGVTMDSVDLRLGLRRSQNHSQRTGNVRNTSMCVVVVLCFILCVLTLTCPRGAAATEDWREFRLLHISPTSLLVCTCLSVQASKTLPGAQTSASYCSQDVKKAKTWKPLNILTRLQDSVGGNKARTWTTVQDSVSQFVSVNPPSGNENTTGDGLTYKIQHKET